MNKKILVIMIMVISTMVVLQSCKKDENETKISSYNDTESHNIGQNCMNCHYSGGSGEGWFTLAGTVYDSLKTSPYPNTTIKLYSGPNETGNFLGTIEVDGLGNFYTTNQIEFGNGLYPSASGNTTTKRMVTPVISGQCNSCHGQSVDRIWTK